MSDAPHDEFADLADLARASGLTEPLRASRQVVRTDDGQETARSGGTRRTAGRRGSPTCTGSASTRHSFDHTALAVGEPAVALDLPGHGRSGWREDADYAASATAPSVLAALDALGVPPGIVVGHSLGAILAARLAATAPEHVTGLVLVDMSPDFAQRAVERIARALETEEPFADLEQVVDRAVEARVGDDREVLRREAGTRRCSGGRPARAPPPLPAPPAGRTSSVGRFADAWPDLEALDVPILLVRGDRGYVSPKLLTQFTERLPDAEVVTVEARHAVQNQAPRELAAAIRAWAERHALLHPIEEPSPGAPERRYPRASARAEPASRPEGTHTP